MAQDFYDTLIVGGGFFGCSVAAHLAKSGQKVVILEQADSLLSRASFGNQARVHGGYHYPRSITTGLRSQANYGIFLKTYPDCIDRTFKKYYAISRQFSNVTASQFKIFCDRISAPVKPAPEKISKLFNADLIEDVFEVEECAFNATKLAERMTGELARNNVEVRFGVKAERLVKDATSNIVAETSHGAVAAKKVYICVYSSLNAILNNSGLSQIALRHEMTELALVKPPVELENVGVTVMCGPFFSIMPFPARKLHSLSHVRYTPRFSWSDADSLGTPRQVMPWEQELTSGFLFMKKDSERYLPCVGDCNYVSSIWETKTLLPRNEFDDARPILHLEHPQMPGVNCVIGGKIDNVFDVISEISNDSKK